MADHRLETARLVLRHWVPDDRAPFGALNADPEVMAHFPAPLTADESGELADRIVAFLAERDWGLWAVEVPGECTFVGYVGLQPVPFEAPFTPAVEIGWRLARPYWGRGYATEAARAAMADGFSRLGMTRVVSFTASTNTRSEAVMVRLGMQRLGEFDHPRLPPGHRLRRHLLYEAWADGTAPARALDPTRAVFTG